MIPSLIEQIELVIAGEQVDPDVVARAIDLTIDNLALPVIRVKIELEGALPNGWSGAQGTFTDRTYGEREGWRAVIVRGSLPWQRCRCQCRTSSFRKNSIHG